MHEAAVMPARRRFSAVLKTPASIEWVAPNLGLCRSLAAGGDQRQTNDVFGKKWNELIHGSDDFARMTTQQCSWYLTLYGFTSERALAEHLSACEFVLDCGTGTGNKAAWFAELNASSTVVAIDASDSVRAAAAFYADKHPNLLFLQADIGRMPFLEAAAFDYVNCDQVIHHTANPPQTFRELVRLTRPGRDLTCYVYRKKALPRELLDDHFREYCKSLSHEELSALSSQLTELGRILSEIPGEIDVPAIPALGIEAERTSVQRFIYWNFLKCFWNAELGRTVSMLTNYDWYSPTQAARYSEEEFRSWIEAARLSIIHFHKEHACYSGRFRKPDGGSST